MPNLDLWAIPDARPYSEASRAAAAWRRILDRPTTISIRNRGDQIVRIEYDDTTLEENAPAVGTDRTSGLQRVVVFGVRNHPTIADTIIHARDRFGIIEQGQTVAYEVISLIYAPGEIQALCEART